MNQCEDPGSRFLEEQKEEACTGPTGFFYLWQQALAWEIEWGLHYYQDLQNNLTTIADYFQVPPLQTYACFAVLSPNASEKSNYVAVEMSIRNHLAGVHKYNVPAYTPNKIKARRILAGEPIDNVIGGTKVTSFYHNIRNCEDDAWLTIDGHMFNAWRRKKALLRRETAVSKKAYQQCTQDLRLLANSLQLSAPKVQAVLWHVWKRTQNILYTPQTSFKWEYQPFPHREPDQRVLWSDRSSVLKPSTDINTPALALKLF